MNLQILLSQQLLALYFVLLQELAQSLNQNPTPDLIHHQAQETRSD